MMKSVLICIIALALANTGCENNSGSADFVSPQTLLLNREGNTFLKTEKTQEASERYLSALRYDPYRAELHLNLGLSFEMLGMSEKALQSYKYADELAQKDNQAMISFMARFNAAQLLGKAKKVDEALEFYQKALDVHPASIETKHNIELLIQQQQGGGQGDGEQDPKDQKGDQNKDSKGQGDGQEKDPKDDKKDGEGDKEKDQDKPKEPKSSPKYKPRPFAGKELDESDVKKILGEIKQQEQKIRADFNRKEQKEQPRDKDW